MIEINYPTGIIVINRKTGKKEEFSPDSERRLMSSMDCSIIAKETPAQISAAAQKAADEKIITETRSKDEIVKYISSKKWQIAGLPCTLNGGTYQLFSPIFKVGWNSAAAGKLRKQTSNLASYTTEPIDGKTFRHEITIKSGGNQMIVDALRNPYAIISYSMDEYILLDENTMQKTSVDNRQLNYDLMAKGVYQLDNTAQIGKVTIVKACKA